MSRCTPYAVAMTLTCAGYALLTDRVPVSPSTELGRGFIQTRQATQLAARNAVAAITEGANSTFPDTATLSTGKDTLERLVAAVCRIARQGAAAGDPVLSRYGDEAVVRSVLSNARIATLRPRKDGRVELVLELRLPQHKQP